MSREHLIPGPEHPITVTPSDVRVVVRSGEHVVADSTNALALQESTYPVAYYLPIEDTNQELLQRTDHSTYCPFKGDASYYSVVTPDGTVENSVWSYEKPYDAVSPIAGRVAFYTDRLEVTVVSGQ
ncbi:MULTISPECIES: DUF427 domain-containing protein [Dactylosporangium]|uniref:DUF427 domain-containing protein n=2 Tax=Dactylosporangium TaxID=35753 RepID=A0A9W6KGH8_9ACTN|nr:MULTISPECIES: DUF427 domain-containing protein [Dactylosporangium]UAB99278.1 DUF427 domain-containing protein [Dactylosporangium vinaceum]UWZ47508.1 DUF427 domain-containing protein [Dactylosporangium matsuzakiense]GLL01666.1 hypothetical protein GCM10017581_034080 [Dactylosporangium matsuzakiense]